MVINRLTVSLRDSLLFPESFVFDFKQKNLITSSKNSLGKTTLIRFLLNSIGFKIPSTKGIAINQYRTSLEFHI